MALLQLTSASEDRLVECACVTDGLDDVSCLRGFSNRFLVSSMLFIAMQLHEADIHFVLGTLQACNMFCCA